MCSFNTLSTTGIYIVIFFIKVCHTLVFFLVLIYPLLCGEGIGLYFIDSFPCLRFFFAMLKKYSVIKNGKEKFASCGRPHMWIFNNNFIAMSIF